MKGTGKKFTVNSSGDNAKVHVDMMEDVIYEEYPEQPTRTVAMEMTENTIYTTIA